MRGRREMHAIVSRAMWASNSRIQFCGERGALSRHIALQEDLHKACAPAHVMIRVQPLSSALASSSASASSNLRRPDIRKPQIVEWRENMPSNKATLIGTLARELRIQYLSSGNVVASSSLRVRRYPQSFSWFYLEFWDDLAEVAAAHLKMGDRIFVSGSLWQEIVVGKDGLKRTFAKMVAKELKLVELNCPEYAASFQNYKVKIDELWNDLFDNRVDWTDFRGNKKNNRHPDFVHKDLNSALWIDNKYTPDWARERLMNEE